MTKTPKRPRDPNQLAKFVIDMATGEEAAPAESSKTARARKGGSKGGPARSKALSPSARSEIASIAANARWKRGD
jgi:hypothetical protein